MRTIFFLSFFFFLFPFFSFGLVLTDFIQSARRIGLPFFAVSFLPAVIRILSTPFRRIAGYVVLWFLEGEELFFPLLFLEEKGTSSSSLQCMACISESRSA